MPNYPNRCQHLHTNGTQCGSPALRRKRFCYFHKRYQDERIRLNTDRRRRGVATFILPVLEDANSIQMSLMQIMRLLLTGQIEHKTASLLLYALQTASSNLRQVDFAPSEHRVILDPRDAADTALGAYHLWSDEDFEDEVDDQEEEERRRRMKQIRAEDLAQAEAERKADLNAWTEKRVDMMAGYARLEAARDELYSAAVEASQEPTPHEIERYDRAKRELAVATKADAASFELFTKQAKSEDDLLAKPKPKPAQPAKKPAVSSAENIRQEISKMVRETFFPGMPPLKGLSQPQKGEHLEEINLP